MARRIGVKRETSAGGVLVRCVEQEPQYLLILDPYQKWGLPKGHVVPGESSVEAARREILEETALDDLIYHGELGTIDWYFRLRGQPIHKFCHYFLFESRSGEACPQLEEGITACRWYPLEQAVETIAYDNARELLQKAAQMLPTLCPKGDGSRQG